MTLAVALAGLVLALLVLRFARRRVPTVPLALPEPSRARTEHSVLVAAGTLLVLGLLVLAGADRGKAAARNAAATARGTTVVAVDVSSSVSWNARTKLGATLGAVARRIGDRAGLVVFADTAAVVLPPTTPAAEIARIAPFFGRRQPPLDGQPLPPFAEATYAPSGPWGEAFLGGTSIASGLALAGTALRRSGVPAGEGRIVLLSDLEDGGRAGDLTRAMRRLRGAGVEIDAVPLHAELANRQLFRLLGARIVARPDGLARDHARALGPAAQGRGDAPFLAAWTLLFAAVLLAVYGWASPLQFTPRQAGGGT